MITRLLFLASLALSCLAQVASADFLGPTTATKAMSSDGNLVVRVKLDAGFKIGEASAVEGVKRLHELTFYEYSVKDDKYVQRSSFMADLRAQFLFVSNDGIVAMISLLDMEAIRLYSKDGKQIKSWNLDKFLSPAEIKACAKTGSTLQWLEEGAFSNGTFNLRGPSQWIDAIQPPYTAMRPYDEKVSFAGRLNLETMELTMDKPE
jgi:hypothetical protein